MKPIKKPLLLFVLVLGLMSLSSKLFFQIDLTNDKRYSLSENTVKQLEELKEPLRIDVFLAGDLPTPYLRFRN